MRTAALLLGIFGIILGMLALGRGSESFELCGLALLFPTFGGLVWAYWYSHEKRGA